MKTCQQCGYENKDEMNFCVNCGNKLVNDTPPENKSSEDTDTKNEALKVCNECGYENKDEMNFCVNCGNKLDDTGQQSKNTTDTKKEEKNTNTNTKKENMGSYKPKIGPDGINKKFIKKEKKVAKKTTKQLCPVADLYFLSTNEEEYKRSAELFKEWVDNYVIPKLHKIWYFGLYEHWRNFKTNCIYGLFSLMVIGDYDECLVYCNKLLDLEETVYSKGIGSHTANGLIAGIKTFAAMTGKTGNKEQEQLYQRIRLVKVACLYELKEYQEAKDLIVLLPESYGFEFNDRDEYYNQNFKYKDTFLVKDFKKLLNM